MTITAHRLRQPGEPSAADQPERRQLEPGARGWSWFWLVAGAAMLPFATLQTLLPLVAWVSPVLLLRFTRTQRLVVSLPVLVVVMSLASLVALRDDFFPIAAGLGYALFVLGLGVGGAVPYAVDRLLAPHLGSTSRTLVFPLAVTASELLATVGNPFGTAGSVAYSQYASLPLVQLVALTGIWGLTFLVCWLAPVVNQLWENGWSASARTAGRGPVLFLVALCAVLGFGGVRLAFPGAPSETVRVAALAPNRELSDLAYATPAGGARTTAERAALRETNLAPVIDDLFARSLAEARAGAKIISWSEAAALVLEEDQRAVVARAARLARQERVYLQVSMIVPLAQPQGGIENENHAVLLDPSGGVVWDYLKSKPTPGDGHAPGPGVIPTVDTPYGRLATAICQDDFFPALLRQAGRADVDILLLPSSDWESAAAWHAQQTPFRAVENGMAVVRATRQGVSLVADGQGRLLGYKPDYFVAADQTLVASVPTRGQDPAYARLGDTFAYVSMAGLLLLAGRAIRRRQRRRS